MARRTIFLDVLDPSLPEEAQLAIEEQMEELRAFRQLRPSPWKRFVSLVSFVSARRYSPREANEIVLSFDCGVVDVVACAGGCVCG